MSGIWNVYKDLREDECVLKSILEVALELHLRLHLLMHWSMQKSAQNDLKKWNWGFISCWTWKHT